MYDDTYRIPLQVRWPGVADGGSRCEVPVHLHDLAATFLEIADVPVPDDFDSRSLVPCSRTEAICPRGTTGGTPHSPSTTATSSASTASGWSARTGTNYVYNGPDIDELYDLEADPDELQNLIDHPEYADARREMRERLIEWMDETADPNRMWVSGVLENAS